MLKVLVTAGSTQMPIDKVRCISNIFKGRTGSDIAGHFYDSGYEVTLIGNNYTFDVLNKNYPENRISCLGYKTYDELYNLMKKEITEYNYDIIIHSAAVSDFKCSAAYSDIDDLIAWDQTYKRGYNIYNQQGKIPSGNTLYLALTPTEKIVDKIKTSWNYKNLLVKFKLQVGLSSDKLIEIAKNSLKQSDADFIVANNLDDFSDFSKSSMFIIDKNDKIVTCSRTDLPKLLLSEMKLI